MSHVQNFDEAVTVEMGISTVTLGPSLGLATNVSGVYRASGTRFFVNHSDQVMPGGQGLHQSAENCDQPMRQSLTNDGQDTVSMCH